MRPASNTLERDFAVKIKELVNKELERELDVPATIFQAPNSIKEVKPEAYTPQLIGLGPFHHFRTEISQTQKDKVGAVKRFLGRHPNFQLNEFIKNARQKEEKLSISSFYGSFFDLHIDVLVWMTVIDALFLLELLSENSKSNNEPQGRGYEYQVAGKELVQNAILRDVMMLENQIPLIFLYDIAKNVKPFTFPSNLLAFFKALSPLKVIEKADYIKAGSRSSPHLLCLLYNLILPIEMPKGIQLRTAGILEGGEGYNMADILDDTIAGFKVIANTNSPWFQGLKGPINMFLGLYNLPFNKLSSLVEDASAPLVEDKMIPTASSLAYAGLKFKPNPESTQGLSFEFDEKEGILYLPFIKIGVNSEVILRNLVAFEALIGSSSRVIPQIQWANHVACKTMEVARTHVFARYAKLMDGILDSAADVKILKNAGIIESTLENDEDVAKLFGGMSISIGLAADDENIQKVKKFYDNSRSIQRRRLMNRCCSVFYLCLKYVVVILLLALMALQTYCSVYSCARDAGALLGHSQKNIIVDETVLDYNTFKPNFASKL